LFLGVGLKVHSSRPRRTTYLSLQKSKKPVIISAQRGFFQKHKLEHFLYNGRSNSLNTDSKNDPVDKADTLVLVLSKTKEIEDSVI
jgi:hypothetical protein